MAVPWSVRESNLPDRFLKTRPPSLLRRLLCPSAVVMAAVGPQRDALSGETRNCHARYPGYQKV